MKLFFAVIILAAFVFVVPASAQSVLITPKKVTYKRPKPMSEYKKTFTVTYPKIKASTPALSKKIETTLSYSKVLGLNINEEISEIQWLEEADFEVSYNSKGFLTITLSMNGTAAYPDGTSKALVVDLKTGSRVRPVDVFTNLTGLAAMVKRAQKAEVSKALKEMKEDPENKDFDTDQLFETTNFTAKNLDEFEVNDKGVTFIYNYGFVHAVQSLEPEGRLPSRGTNSGRISNAAVCLRSSPGRYLSNNMSERKIRVLVAKPGLDGHDRGAKVIARALRDAGMEVIYTGLRQTPEMIVSAALQEDVDAVGISILSGAHRTLCPRIVNLMRENGMDDTLVLVGGIVPNEDIPELKANGVSEVFLPGTSTEDIVKFINANVRSQN